MLLIKSKCSTKYESGLKKFPDLGILGVEIWDTKEIDIKNWYTKTGEKNTPPTEFSIWDVLR